MLHALRSPILEILVNTFESSFLMAQIHLTSHDRQCGKLEAFPDIQNWDFDAMILSDRGLFHGLLRRSEYHQLVSGPPDKTMKSTLGDQPQTRV